MQNYLIARYQKESRPGYETLDARELKRCLADGPGRDDDGDGHGKDRDRHGRR